MPYEETGIYRARTKTTFELEVVKHRGVYGCLPCTRNDRKGKAQPAGQGQ